MARPRENKLVGQIIPSARQRLIGLSVTRCWPRRSSAADKFDDEVEALAYRIAGVPQNQLMMQKLMINQALYNMGLQSTQMIATVFDGITRHSREGLNFKHRAEAKGWKHAVEERDQGTFDWTENAPMKSNR